MTPPARILLAALVLRLSGPLQAAMSEGAPDTKPAAASPAGTSGPSESFIRSWSVMGGVSSFRGEITPALGLRAGMPRDFSVELAGTFLDPVHGIAHEESGGNVDHTASFAESHLAILRSVYDAGPLAVELGAGASFAIVNDSLYEGGPIPTTFRDRKYLPGPLVMLGARWRITSHLSLLADLAWADYVNHVSYGPLQSFDLSFSGVMLRPALEWTF